MMLLLRIISISKSRSARETCDYYVECINRGYMTIEDVRKCIRDCNDPIIANRMAMRLGRLIRKGKVHERSESNL